MSRRFTLGPTKPRFAALRGAAGRISPHMVLRRHLHRPGFHTGDGVADAVYTAVAVHVDAATDLTRGAQMTGAVDGDEATVSFWINMAGSSNGTRYGIWQDDAAGPRGDGLAIRRETDNKIQIIGTTTADSIVQGFKSTTSILAATGWVHIMFSYKGSTTTQHLYYNNSEDLNSSTNSGGDIEYTAPEHHFLALDGADSKFDGDIADFWMSHEYIDLSVAGNRALFIDAGGKPVDLGATGTNPGKTPIAYFSGAVASWHTNKGTGEGFTVN